MRRLLALTTLLPLLSACDSYNCGEAIFATSFGTYEAGEWCGEFGTYALENNGYDQLIVSPNSRDDDIDSATVTFTTAWSIELPSGSFEEGSSYTTDDEGVRATCTITPGGAGSGTLTVVEASWAELEVGRPRSPMFSNDPFFDTRYFDMRWAVDCAPTMTAVGDDVVPVSEGI